VGKQEEKKREEEKKKKKAHMGILEKPGSTTKWMLVMKISRTLQMNTKEAKVNTRM
jgi:hypothetical protein